MASFSMRIGWLVLSGLLLEAAELQEPVYRIRFDRISVEQGLSQNSVVCMVQDHLGFLWLGTEDGLNRFDGYSFHRYGHEYDQPESLSDNRVTCLLETDDGVLWVGTWGGGLNRFDRPRDCFERIEFEGETRAAMNSIRALVADPAGGVIVATQSAGLYHCDGSQVVPWQPPGLAVNATSSALCWDHLGRLWAGTELGVRIYDPHRGLTERSADAAEEPPFTGVKVTALRQDSDANMWVGTFGSGVFRVQDGEVTAFSWSLGDELSLSSNRVVSIASDSQKRLWVGTEGGGLNRYLGKSEFMRYRHDSLDPTSLSDDTVFAIIEDRAGAVWVGTAAGGVNRFDGVNSKFNHFNHRDSDPDGLSHNMVFPIMKDGHGDLWIGTKGGGLNRFDAESHRFTHYRHDPNDPTTLGDDDVFALLEDDQGTLWVGTNQGGLNRFRGESQTFERFLHQADDSHSPAGDRVVALMQDRQGRIWIGTNGTGLDALQTSSMTFTHHRFDGSDDSSISDDRISCLFQDRAGRIWAGSNGGGLNRVLGEGRFQRFQHARNQSGSISHDVILCMQEDSRQMFWVGTAYGLNLFDRETETFRRWTVHEGLPNNVIYAVLEDERGRLWISTNYGIAIFDPFLETFKNFDQRDGLQSNEFNFGSYFKGADGRMYFGGINGFNTFFPRDMQESTFVPGVVLTELRIGNQVVAPNSNDPEAALKESIITAKSIQLNPSQRMFSISFAALDFTDPERNQYAYQLEGYDETWIATDAQNRRATYTNLPAGRYVFRAKGTNRDGVWNDRPASLCIEILPFWWQRLEIKAVVLVCLVLLLMGIHRSRVSRLLETERLRNRIARDLHDDMGAALTNITVLANLVRVSPEQSATRRHLRLIEETSRDLVSRMRDLVWSVDSRNDKVGDLVDRMQDFAANILANIDFHFEVGDLQRQRPLPPDLRQNLFLIFKEALGNCVRHSGATYIRIQLNQVGRELQLSIQDNGCGMDVAVQSKGNGLRNMKWRARAIKGTLNLESRQGLHLQLLVGLP